MSWPGNLSTDFCREIAFPITEDLCSLFHVSYEVDETPLLQERGRGWEPMATWPEWAARTPRVCTLQPQSSLYTPFSEANEHLQETEGSWRRVVGIMHPHWYYRVQSHSRLEYRVYSLLCGTVLILGSRLPGWRAIQWIDGNFGDKGSVRFVDVSSLPSFRCAFYVCITSALPNTFFGFYPHVRSHINFLLPQTPSLHYHLKLNYSEASFVSSQRTHPQTKARRKIESQKRENENRCVDKHSDPIPQWNITVYNARRA